jgi:hypothetical protein
MTKSDIIAMAAFGAIGFFFAIIFIASLPQVPSV